MEKTKIISLADYKRTLEPVSYEGGSLTLLDCGYGPYVISTFAHVLNTGHEDLWPGDVAIFYPELFACRLSDATLYRDTSHFAEHKRCETQRRCWPYAAPLVYYDYDFYRCLHGGAFPPDVVMQRDDEDVDTLNSELLLTEEYILPQDVQPFGKKKPDF